MGYRSQVAGIFSVDEKHEDGKWVYDQATFKEMIGFIKLSRFYQVWQVENEADAKHFGWQNGKFILYGADWKWYPDYSDVQAWDDLWNQMRDMEDKGISGYFCRVGEENGDIEEMEFGMNPCRDFFYPFSALHFEGEEFLGKRDTDVEENQADQAPTNQEKESCGSSVAQSA